MEVGKLYQIKNYHWMLYPSKDTAAVAFAAGGALAAVAAVYWSRELGCSVSYMSPKDMFMLLEKDGIFCKVLSTEGQVGWILLSDWSKKYIEEVKAE
jgi:hypothetical protein